MNGRTDGWGSKLSRAQMAGVFDLRRVLGLRFRCEWKGGGAGEVRSKKKGGFFPFFFVSERVGFCDDEWHRTCACRAEESGPVCRCCKGLIGELGTGIR